MEPWQKPFWELFDSVVQEVDRVVSEVDAAITTIATVFEVVAEQVQQTITTELEKHVPPEFYEAWEAIDLSGWLEESASEFHDPDLSDFQDILHTVELMSPEPSPCAGCCHFHGLVYSGNALVCAMHPYGPEAEECPDWEPHSD
jgi:hypothetical protein